MQFVIGFLVAAIALIVPGGLVGLGVFYSVKEWRKRKHEQRRTSGVTESDS